MFTRVWVLIRRAWEREPVRVLTGVAAVIVFAAAKAGVVITTDQVWEAFVIVLPILGLGEVARGRVTPFVAEGPGDELHPALVSTRATAKSKVPADEGQEVA